MPVIRVLVIRPGPPRSARQPRPGRGRAASRSPCRKTTVPSTITWVTSSATAAKTAVFSSAPVPAVRGLAASSVTRSARWPTAIRPTSSQPRESWPRRGGLEQLGRRPVPALLRGQPLVELHGAHLLEQVDHRVAVAAQGEPRPGVVRGDGWGRCRRRGRARWSGRSRRRAGPRRSGAMSSSVRCVAWTAGRVLVEGAGLGDDLRRGQAVGREALLVLRHLLGQVEVQRREAVRAIRIWSRGTARTEWKAPPMRTPSASWQLAQPLTPSRRRRRRRTVVARLQAVSPMPAAR